MEVKKERDLSKKVESRQALEEAEKKNPWDEIPHPHRMLFPLKVEC